MMEIGGEATRSVLCRWEERVCIVTVNKHTLIYEFVVRFAERVALVHITLPSIA